MNRGGDALVKKANKKLKPGFFDRILGNKEDRIEEAIELFKEAANHYKIEGTIEKAVSCYTRCSDLSKSIKRPQDAADSLEEAGSLTKESNPAQSIQFYKEAATLYKSCGKSAYAAKNYKIVAAAYEQEVQYELAVENYREAARLFSLEKYKTTDTNKCTLKVAELLSRDCSDPDPKQIIDAIKTFEKIAVKYTQESLLRHSAQEIFFKACLLFLIIDDEIGMERMIEKASDKDPFFNSCSEKKFLVGALEAYRDSDLAAYSELIGKWRDRLRMDKWKTGVLANIKRRIEARSGKKKTEEGANSDQEEADEGVDEEFNPF